MSGGTDVVQGIVSNDGYWFAIDRFDEKGGDIRIGRSDGFNDIGDCYTPDSSSPCRPSCGTAD